MVKSIRKISVIVLCAMLTSCFNKSETQSPTIKTKQDIAHRYFRLESKPDKLATLTEQDKLWGGIVSHHDLTGELLDEYFLLLKNLRCSNPIKVFYILSPAHFGIAKNVVSLTKNSYETSDGLSHIDKKKVDVLAKAFNVQLDDDAFTNEHGISTIVPFIKKYFPNALIVPVLFDAINNYTGKNMHTFAQTFSEHFLQQGEESFCLISSDFSHKANLKTTLERDKQSAEFFKTLKSSNVMMLESDNIPSILALATIAKTKPTKVITLYQTNALEIAPSLTDPNDITSYFFSYFSYDN